MSDKKTLQLGMNPSTASGRLVKDLLWHFISTTTDALCCKCNQPLERSTFSVEHIEPWLDSDDPVGNYFNISNIGFSHLRCNIADVRRKTAQCGSHRAYAKGCRCTLCKEAKKDYQASRYTSEKRKEIYATKGY